MKDLYKGFMIEILSYEEAGKWIVSAEITTQIPVAGNVNKLAGIMKGGFDTQEEAEGTGLVWAKSEVDKWLALER